MEEKVEVVQRTRMNVSTNAKGLAQFDITTEYSTPEEAAENLKKALAMVRALIKDQGLQEAK